MLVRGVVRNEVEDDPDAAAARLTHQPIERREVAELRMHVAIVADVVAPVLERRRIDGAKPDRVDPKRPIGAVIEIVEVFDDAVEVSYSISVRVGKTARVDLIEDRPAPPFVGHPVLPASAEYHNADSAPVLLEPGGEAPRGALWLSAVEAEIPEPAARLRGILSAHHQPRGDSRRRSQHPRRIQIEHEAVDPRPLQQVARHRHLDRIDAVEDLLELSGIVGISAHSDEAASRAGVLRMLLTRL